MGEQKLAGKQFSLFTYCNDIPKKLNMYSPRFLFPIKRHIEYQIKQANNKNIKNKIKNLKYVEVPILGIILILGA